MFSAVRMRQKEKSIIASQRNMNSVSFIFHTVKMTWPSFPQKSKYPQSVFNSIAGHKFTIKIFWIENCDFIFVVLWKIGFSLDPMEYFEQKGFMCCITRDAVQLPLASDHRQLVSLSCPTYHGHSSATSSAEVGTTGLLVVVAAPASSPVLGAQRWAGTLLFLHISLLAFVFPFPKRVQSTCYKAFG